MRNRHVVRVLHQQENDLVRADDGFGRRSLGGARIRRQQARAQNDHAHRREQETDRRQPIRHPSAIDSPHRIRRGHKTSQHDGQSEEEPERTADTRAVLAVSPNNPTGSIVRRADADELTGRCGKRGAALILDEVFWDYPLGPPLDEPPAFVTPSSLTCRLGGLSKSIGLPQVKLGWIALDGPADIVSDALDRLELICDTYLSVSTPVQVAVRSLIERGAPVRQQIRDRLRVNDAALRAIVARDGGVTVLPADQGAVEKFINAASRAAREGAAA